MTDDLAQGEDLLQRYQARIEKSQQDRVSKFCTDAGFLTTVEVGQYFMTKDTEEFSQFTGSVACREHTLPRDENFLNQKIGFGETLRLDPYWKLQLVAYKVNIWSENQNRVHEQGPFSLVGQNFSWLKQIGHRFDRQGQDYNEQETSEMQLEDYALKSNARVFASRSKAKAKPQRRISVSSFTKTIYLLVKEFVKTTPQMTRFRDVQQATIMATV